MSSATDDEPQLTLEAVSDEGTLLLERRKSFGSGGGTIGRSPTCDWVLKDDFVSRQHARISYAGGRFFIEDTNSTSGVSLNDRRLVSGQRQPLEPRDRLFIKPYAIVVVASTAAASRAISPSSQAPSTPARKPELLRDLASGDPLKTHLPTAATQLPPTSHELDQWDLDPLLRNLLDESVAIPARAQPAATRETSTDIPPARPVPSVKEQASPAVPAMPPKVGPSHATDLDRLLANAGLDATRVTPEVAEQLGEILRTVVDGLLDVLSVRQKARDEFRIQGTMFRPRGNNPLKFSTDVEDALHNLFVKRGAGYLGPVEAFEEAFNDLRHHQLAVVVAMKKAFAAVLEKFQPAHLQRRFDQTSKGGKGRLGLLQGTPNYWALYGEWAEGLLKDPDASFRDLYGEVFSRTYEEELRRLRAQLRSSEPRDKE